MVYMGLSNVGFRLPADDVIKPLALVTKLLALLTVLSTLTIVPFASSKRAERSVGSIPFKVAPVATEGARDDPALISRNRLPTTPSVPTVTTESARTSPLSFSLMRSLTLKFAGGAG